MADEATHPDDDGDVHSGDEPGQQSVHKRSADYLVDGPELEPEETGDERQRDDAENELEHPVDPHREHDDAATLEAGRA